MFKDITIGQYFPGESIVHRFDPRLKIITMIFFIISLFFINTFIPYIFVAIYLFIIIKIGNLPLKVVHKVSCFLICYLDRQILCL